MRGANTIMAQPAEIFGTVDDMALSPEPCDSFPFILSVSRYLITPLPPKVTVLLRLQLFCRWETPSRQSI